MDNKVRELPMLFQPDMVRAILRQAFDQGLYPWHDWMEFANPKTQTRRIVQWPVRIDGKKITKEAFENGVSIAPDWANTSFLKYCRYQPGMRLWVKETWGVSENIFCCAEDLPNIKVSEVGPFHPVVHFAGKENYAWGMYGPPKKRSARFMFKTMARIWLEIVDVKIVPVQKITPRECLSEGITLLRDTNLHAFAAFHERWDEINAKRGFGWDKNPWVTPLTFKVLEVHHG